jgi:hypothetical protein
MARTKQSALRAPAKQKGGAAAKTQKKSSGGGKALKNKAAPGVKKPHHWRPGAWHTHVCARGCYVRRWALGRRESPRTCAALRNENVESARRWPSLALPR